MVDLVPHRRAFGRLLRAGRLGHQRTVAVIADEDGAAVAVIRLQKRNGGNARVDGFPQRGGEIVRRFVVTIPAQFQTEVLCDAAFVFSRSIEVFGKRSAPAKHLKVKIPVLLYAAQALPAVAAAVADAGIALGAGRIGRRFAVLQIGMHRRQRTVEAEMGKPGEGDLKIQLFHKTFCSFPTRSASVDIIHKKAVGCQPILV